MPNERSTTRRWFRYSLRTFLILVTTVCVVLGIVVKRQRDRYLAIEAIKRWGGVVDFADPPTDVAESVQRFKAMMSASQRGAPRPVFAENEPQGRAWQRRLFGKYSGSNIVRISMVDDAFAPDDSEFDVRVLKHLPEVKSLLLGEPIDDDALVQLPILPKLQSLHLTWGAKVSDRGLQCLERLPNLKELHIDGGRFTAEGMACIGSVRGLNSLTLFDCDVSDGSLSQLTRLNNLEELHLEFSTITDEGLAQLSRLHGLVLLRISGAYTTEAGIARLKAAVPRCEIRFSR
jgi:hypothetical protein